jgi:hypothetical protein
VCVVNSGRLVLRATARTILFHVSKVRGSQRLRRDSETNSGCSCRAALYDRNGRWFVIKGFRSISANVVVLIDRIIVLNERKISPRPLCNAKCHIRKRLPFILEMFTKLSSSVFTSPFYRTAAKTPSRQCNASGACGTVRALSTIPSGC